jgi:hypothetical protein
MKKLNSIFFLIFLIFIIFLGCKKKIEEPFQDQYLLETYQSFLDGLILDCPTDSSEYYFKAKIKGEETCYYDGIDGKKLLFGITAKYTTVSPNTSTANPSYAVKSAILSIRNEPFVQADDYILIGFPDFAFERDTVEYLDSIFSIEYHEIRSNLEEPDRFQVELQMMDLVKENAGVYFPISTRFGNQDDSYIRFRNVEQIREFGHVYYSIEMEVECNLYHWPQYGKEGLWGKVEDGIFVAKFLAKYKQ